MRRLLILIRLSFALISMNLRPVASSRKKEAKVLMEEVPSEVRSDNLFHKIGPAAKAEMHSVIFSTKDRNLKVLAEVTHMIKIGLELNLHSHTIRFLKESLIQTIQTTGNIGVERGFVDCVTRKFLAITLPHFSRETLQASFTRRAAANLSPRRRIFLSGKRSFRPRSIAIAEGGVMKSSFARSRTRFLPISLNMSLQFSILWIFHSIHLPPMNIIVIKS